MTGAGLELEIRPMVATDIGKTPIGCQGSLEAIAERIDEIGASAMLAFEGDRHVAQLQFRRYDRRLRSPNGLWDPLYWGDFGAHAPELPTDTLSLFCYHVGQIDDTEYRESRYQGCGLGARLLDATISWARENGFSAVVAKAAPSLRPVMAFMGGQPVEVYRERGFEVVASWLDPQLQTVVQEKRMLDEDAKSEDAATISCCVLRM